jgi:sterol desaturase/sphingolipid hydroxylase (fatty acid hydroxylase superfamily)
MLYSALINLLILAAIFIPLERVFPARVQRIVRPDLVLDACFFLGQYLVTTVAILSVLGFLSPRINLHTISHASPVAQVIVAVMLGDFLVYWFHRACHHFDFLWRFHSVHHTAEHLDWVAAHREHPFDGIATATLINLPAIVLGVPSEYLAGIAVFRACWAIFVHSNVRVPLGPLKWLFGGPELHHWHHARESRHNFANLAPYLDVLFGTHHVPARDTYALGLDRSYPKSYLALLLWPITMARDEQSSRRAAEAACAEPG